MISSSEEDEEETNTLCLYFPERPANISPRSQVRIFSFTIDQIEKFPVLREILTPLTIPSHSLYLISDDVMYEDIPVYCVFGNNIIQKYIHRGVARLVFENYLAEISSTIPFSGNVEVNMFTKTINGITPEQFLEAIRVRFLEDE